jgi:2-hydroxy-3-oxopropionate reductase
MAHKPTIAFLGTGLMGSPMARNLLRAGFSLHAWNRSHEKAAALGAEGAVVFIDPREAVREADVLITMLKDGPAVREVVFQQGVAEALPKGATHIDMGSISPAEAIEHARLHEKLGHPCLDAPVSGGTIGATEGKLAIMAGGEEETFHTHVPIFEAMGTPTHIGPHGCGQLSKLANQVIVAVTIGAVSEAFILAGAGGADPAKVRQALQGGFASSRILSEHGLRMVERNFQPGGPAKFQLKDLNNALNAANTHNLDLPITRLLQQLYDAMISAGGGELDHSALLTHLEKMQPDQKL